jgi:hypothetical protein
MPRASYYIALSLFPPCVHDAKTRTRQFGRDFCILSEGEAPRSLRIAQSMCHILSQSDRQGLTVFFRAFNSLGEITYQLLGGAQAGKVEFRGTLCKRSAASAAAFALNSSRNF